MDRKNTLIVFLTMHRSGSSFVTSMFQRLGMSLGPFELFGALPSNRYGHFEAVPVLKIQHAVLNRVFGFPDMPRTPSELREFSAREGRWDRAIPKRLLGRGIGFIRELTASGPISGFKDPHTVLLWPYWLQVFSSFPDLRVVPVFIIRSPHAIAMSLFMRHWESPYQDSLDIAAVHLQQMTRIDEAWRGDRAVIRYDPRVMEGDLRDAAACCGLPWNERAIAEVYDAECRHQQETPVAHEAQTFYDRLRSVRDPEPLAPNSMQLVKDAELRELLVRRRLTEMQTAVAGCGKIIGRRDREIAQLHKRVEQQEKQIEQQQLHLTRFEHHVVLRPLLWLRRNLKKRLVAPVAQILNVPRKHKTEAS